MMYLRAVIGGMGRGVRYCAYVAIVAIILSLH
jgi:hypothetical protein